MPRPFALLLLCVLAGVLLCWPPPNLRADAAKPRFTDVAGRSRFAYKTNNDFRERKYFPQPMCGGIAAFDYDGDGLVDLFFTNGARMPEMEKTSPAFYNCLLRNKGDGTFEDVTERAHLTGKDLGFSFGVAAGDYDNDGRPDLFVANAGRNTLYHNNGDGTFSDVTAVSGIGVKPDRTLSVAAAWFDYDNDGRLDLVLTNYTFWTPATDKVCKMGGVEYYCSPTAYESVPQRLYHNLGGGKFADVTDASGFGAALGKGMGIGIADFNGDGYTDVFIANDTERNFLFVNQGKGTFKEEGLLLGVAYNDSASTVSAMGCDVKDYDNDGFVDVFYNNLMGQVWGLFRNVKGSSFRYVSPVSRIAQLSQAMSGWSNGFIDYDNDGWKDLYSSNGDVDYIARGARQHDTMFRNDGGRGFTDVSESLGPDFLTPGFQRGSVFADLNNDGWLDLVVTSLGARPRILMNSGEGAANWLLVDTVGHKSNRDGVGARLKLTTASGRTLFNHVTASVGFMSSSDKRVHFGLGAENAIRSLEIRWPGGATQTLTNVAPNHILRVEEPR